MGPVVVNIVLYHLCFDPRLPWAGFGGAAVWLVLLWQHRKQFLPLLFD